MASHFDTLRSLRSALLVCAAAFALNGCSLIIGKTGDKVPPGQVGADRSGVTGVATDCMGNILYYCCQTACVKPESAKEFENDFVEGLTNAISDPETRRRVMSHIEFEYVPAALCSSASSMTFAAVNATGSQKSAEITPGELAGSGSGGARGQLKAVLEYFAKHEAGDPGLFLRITLPICSDGGGGGSASTSISTCTPSSTSDATSRVGEYEQQSTRTDVAQTAECCGSDCTPPADSEEEIDINWKGIL